MASSKTAEIDLAAEFQELIRPFVFGSVTFGFAGGGLPRFDPAPQEFGIDGHIRADTLPDGMPDDPKELRSRLLARSEELMDELAAHLWYPCHSTMRQEFTTQFSSPTCTFGNEVVLPPPQHTIALAFSVTVRKFAGMA